MYSLLNIFIPIFSFTIGLYLNKDFIHYVHKKYMKWKSLLNLVSTQHNYKIMIYWISFTMVIESFYLSLIQYLNDSIKKLDKNKYEVSYVINGKMYKMIVNPKRGPLPFIMVKNEKNEDVTDIISPYLGPNNDWHTKKYCPDFFKCKKLVFELLNGEKVIFSDNDTIII